MIDYRVMYLMSGQAHLPYLVCSLYTLRQHWHGEIVVYAWPKSIELVRRIGQDERLGVRVEERIPDRMYKRNSQFIDKIHLAMSLKDEAKHVLYLDADTTIHGRIDSLFSSAMYCGFAATQWNEWVTTGKMVSKRIKRLEPFEDIDQRMLQRTLEREWPSVNGGVWCAKPESPVLPVWYNWTVAATTKGKRPVFIADESVLHILQPMFCPNQMTVVQDGGRFNSSPKHRSPRLDPSLVRIYHYHGDSNVRPKTKSLEGYNLWWPIYQKCLEENVGGIAEWHGDVGNKWLDKLEKEIG